MEGDGALSATVSRMALSRTDSGLSFRDSPADIQWVNFNDRTYGALLYLILDNDLSKSILRC